MKPIFRCSFSVGTARSRAVRWLCPVALLVPLLLGTGNAFLPGVLTAACADTPPVVQRRVYIVVRHAEKEKTGQDKLLPLLPEGKSRASELARIVANYKAVTGAEVAVFTTEFVRTKETADKIAGTKTVVNKETAASKCPKLFEALAKSKAGIIVIVGHSDTVPVIVKELNPNGPPAKVPEGKFDNLFVVAQSGAGKSTLALRYGVPSP